MSSIKARLMKPTGLEFHDTNKTIFFYACTIPYNEDRKGSDAPEQEIVYPDETKTQNVRRAFESRNNDI